MQPVAAAWQVGEITFAMGSYGLMMGLAWLIGGLAVVRSATKAGLDSGATIAALAFTLCGSAAGAYGLHVLVSVSQGASWPDAMRTGGWVSFGGLAGGGTALRAACARLGLPWRQLLSLAVPGLALGWAVGRMGCFLAGCCYGTLWEGLWAVRCPVDSWVPSPHLPRHPVALYEAIFVLVWGAAIRRWAPFPLRMHGYLGGYCVARACLELFRGDAIRGLHFGGHVSTAQLICAVVLAGAGIAQLVRVTVSARLS